MNSLVSEPLAQSLRFDADTMWLDLTDHRQLGVPLAYFPRLLNASAEERNKFIISGGGKGLHWDDLDEDISVVSLMMGIGDQTRSRPHSPNLSPDNRKVS